MNHALKGRWRLSGDPFGTKKARSEQRKRTLASSEALEGAVEDTEDAQNDADEEEDLDEEEGILHVETEGADACAAAPKYVYKMMLKVQHAGAGKVLPGGGGKTRNNKLAWLGYWSYNRLTDDWAEFGLRNDRAFFWSRVRSYGDGE